MNYTENINNAKKFSTSKELWNFIEKTYDEEQQIVIEDFYAYHDNIYRGFGRGNDKNIYRENKENDVNGELETIAKIWFDITLPYKEHPSISSPAAKWKRRNIFETKK